MAPSGANSPQSGAEIKIFNMLCAFRVIDGRMLCFFSTVENSL